MRKLSLEKQHFQSTFRFMISAWHFGRTVRKANGDRKTDGN